MSFFSCYGQTVNGISAVVMGTSVLTGGLFSPAILQKAVIQRLNGPNLPTLRWFLRKVGNDLFVICFMQIFLHKPHHWSPPLTLWLLSNCLSMKSSPCLTANFWLLRFFLPLVKNDCGKNWHTPFIDCWNWLRAVSLVSDSESCASWYRWRPAE